MLVRSTFLAALCAVVPLSAQKVFDALNESAPVTYLSTAGNWFVIKRPITAPAVLTALEYRLSSTTATAIDVGMFDEDPITGKPLNLLGSGTVTLTPNVPDWYGAKFTAPIVITTSGNYFLGVKIVSPAKVGLAANSAGTSTPHWWNPTAGWSGPFASYAWPFRLYANGNIGAFVNYGTGKAGSGAFVPALRGLGWPNTGNKVEVQASSGLGGAAVLYIFGSRVSIPLTIGTVYAFPTVSISATAGGTGSGLGYASLELAIPNSPALQGVLLATQAWFLDSGATDGVTHTDGVEMTIGN